MILGMGYMGLAHVHAHVIFFDVQELVGKLAHSCVIYFDTHM